MTRLLTLAAVGATSAALMLPTTAEACGGFFCSSVPVDQSKERIVFAIDEDKGEVETHIQIFYSGAAEEFAWVLPVAGTVEHLPEVGLSTDELFTQLDWRTQPSFNLEWREEGSCTYDGYGFGRYNDVMAESDASAPPSAAGGADEDGVTVLEQNQVGPYDQVTLAADSAELLVEWLQDNDYDLPDSITRVLDPYVHGGMFFVALKLSKDNDAGDISPVKVTYPGTEAMIPLVLTSVAAMPDMRIQPYVLSDRRAVPNNYLHVQINEAAVDWLGWGGNYDDVVTEAANEAGGQAFATDYAGSTEPFAGMLYSEGRFDLERLATITSPGQFVNEMLWMGLPRNTTVQNLIRAFIPMPGAAIAAGIDERSFYNCLDCYAQYLEDVEFDPVGFVAALDEAVVGPLRDAQALFDDHTYLTRMTSSMSADEMTSDPYFTLNADMEEVSNQHWATLVVDCGDGGSYYESPRYIELTDGRVILVPPESWFWETGNSYSGFLEDLGEDAALVVERTSSSGPAMAVLDNSGAAAEAVDAHNDRLRDEFGWADDPTLGDPFVPRAAGCGCNSPGQVPGAAFGLLFVAGLVRRRS